MNFRVAKSSVPASELVAFVKDLLELEKLKDKSDEKESSSTSSSVASSCPLLDNKTPGLLTRSLHPLHHTALPLQIFVTERYNNVVTLFREPRD